jgi:hypothetical protein
MKKRNYTRFLLVALIFHIAFVTYAQKLPNVQQVSQRVPADTKIDGRSIEWNNKFQAYNNATEIYYSIANDNDKLYLAIQATKPDIINKIILGGITFTVSRTGKKEDKGGVAVTFPTFYKNQRPNINLKNIPKPRRDTIESKVQADSFVRAINKELTDKTKLIEVEGVKSITDSIISVYNQEGFKAANLFDNQINYITELAIPLKYLGFSINEPVAFKYHIKLNGAAGHNATIQLLPNGRFYGVTESNGHMYAIPATSQYSSYAFPTDFWGEYTLTKK